jgi:arylformamidase
MRIYDVSVGITPQIPVWPGDSPVTLERVREIARGANANVSRLECGVHVGTHVDAPAHFIEGAATVETLSLDVLNGRAYVVDLPDAEILDAATLESAGIPKGAQRVLFKTHNSEFWPSEGSDFRTDFVAIDEGGAEWLVESGVQLVGIDYLSIAPYTQSQPTHGILLGAGVVVVEGLDLSEVGSGNYELHCLPLKLVGSDGAPARVILVGA